VLSLGLDDRGERLLAAEAVRSNEHQAPQGLTLGIAGVADQVAVPTKVLDLLGHQPVGLAVPVVPWQDLKLLSLTTGLFHQPTRQHGPSREIKDSPCLSLQY